MSMAMPLTHAVGDKTAKALETLGLRTVGDLLHHYPRRYYRRGELTAFHELEVGEHMTIFAEVRSVTTRQIRKGLKKTDITVRDSTGRSMTMAAFNQFRAGRELSAGRRAFFSGKVELFNGNRQLVNPEWQLVDDEDGTVKKQFAGALVPLYRASAKISTFAIQLSVATALTIVDVGPDPLPAELRLAQGLTALLPALQGIHQPQSQSDIDRAVARLKWDEAFVLQVTLAQRRAAFRALPGTARVARPGGLRDALDARLPFALTAGQREVGEVLECELAGTSPMNRLLQGEVGSGKTLVALRAMLTVVDAGGQSALLAPTEVLAQQHARSLRSLLGPLAQAGELEAAEQATRVALLTGSQSATARRSALADVASGEAGIVVGTHALLSEGVGFADLGLVVVDEQHRFGVEQREALRAKGEQPHVLVMTATPIPRTVAMTVFGDLEVSTLTELPPGRSPVKTAVVPVHEKEHPEWLDVAWQRVREAVADGRQAFVVCPRIGDEDEPARPDAQGRRPAIGVAELEPVLTQGPLRGLRTAQLHGRLTPETKDDVMRRFLARELEVLVATTVIEVGVDVPNASVMVVMDAERFGISQLHQLRGRIGRGAHAGLCLLVSESPRGTPQLARLEAVAATSDGFALAQLDLEQRQEGDVLGAAQSGRQSSLRVLRLLDDTDVVVAARAAAVALVDADPALEHHPALRSAVQSTIDGDKADFLEKA